MVTPVSDSGDQYYFAILTFSVAYAILFTADTQFIMGQEAQHCGKLTRKARPEAAEAPVSRISEICGSSSLDAPCSAVLRVFDFTEDHPHRTDNIMYSENSCKYGGAAKNPLDSLSIHQVDELGRASRPKSGRGQGQCDPVSR